MESITERIDDRTFTLNQDSSLTIADEDRTIGLDPRTTVALLLFFARIDVHIQLSLWLIEHETE